ncbi:MAG: hypothetical protein EOP22_13345 [Hyphomicrobiales bacterium]|nr:MAG: hypothetical protein EOP22_13345 [Hyphomicrobiales bacterium]
MTKTITTLALAALMAGASTLSFAAPAETDAFKANDNTATWTSPECEQPGTKEAHPGWFNLGGYCNPYDYDD